jgi:hypothetical protein
MNRSKAEMIVSLGAEHCSSLLHHGCCVKLREVEAQAARLQVRLTAALKIIESARAVMREVEWSGVDILGVADPPRAACPCCENPQKSGHTPDCALSAHLAGAPS